MNYFFIRPEVCASLRPPATILHPFGMREMIRSAKGGSAEPGLVLSTAVIVAGVFLTIIIHIVAAYRAR